MSEHAFDKIAEGLRDALAIAAPPRFGPAYAHKCANRDVIICVDKECRRRGRCMLLPVRMAGDR